MDLFGRNPGKCLEKKGCMEMKKKSNKLQVKDLVTIGIFTAI